MFKYLVLILILVPTTLACSKKNCIECLNNRRCAFVQTSDFIEKCVTKNTIKTLRIRKILDKCHIKTKPEVEAWIPPPPLRTQVSHFNL